MHFEIVGPITDIETIVVGARIRILQILHKRYGKGRWRKLKKGLPLYALMMVPFAWLRYIGSRLTGSARER